MANESSQVNSTVHFRLETGLDVVEDWADTAGRAEKNAVYRALFAMQDGSLFRTYRVIEDFQHAGELFVLVQHDLVMKIQVNAIDSFGVVGIGPCGHAASAGTGHRHAV